MSNPVYIFRYTPGSFFVMYHSACCPLGNITYELPHSWYISDGYMYIHVHLSNVLMQVLRWYIFVFYADQASDAEVFPMEDWQPAWSGKLIYLDSMSCLMITCVVYEYFWVAIGGLYMHVVMVPMCLRAYLHVVCRTTCISIVFLTTCTICMDRIQ